MADNLTKWASNRGLISKFGPSDGRGRDTVPSTVVRGYDLRKLGGHLGNVGSQYFQERERVAATTAVKGSMGRWDWGQIVTPAIYIALIALRGMARV